jgi:drug/metabolite transporter (DMT)-like permease
MSSLSDATRPPTRRPLDLKAIAGMLVLCVIWGIQQVVMKSTAADIAPVMQLGLRFAGSALCFLVLTLMSEGRRAFADGTLPSGLALGVLFSLEFIFVGEAVAHTTAAHSTVFLYSAPIFTALGVQMLPEERLSGGQWVGIGVAFAGIALAFLGYADKPIHEMIIGDALALCAGAIWGASNVTLRRTRVGSASTVKTVFYQVSAAAIILTSYALFYGKATVVFSPRSIASLLFQTIGISIVSYLLWFSLLRHYLTSRLMLFSLLTPLLGVVFGATLLDEPIDPRFGLGAILVVGGIVAVNARQLLNRT